MPQRETWPKHFVAGYAAAIIGLAVGTAVGALVSSDSHKCDPKTQTIYAEQQVTATVCK